MLLRPGARRIILIPAKCGEYGMGPVAKRVGMIVVALASTLASSTSGVAQMAMPNMPDMPGMDHGGHAPAAFPRTVADWARGAKLFAGLGSFHRAISTRSPLAQRYFDQGMRLLWAFNHDEAARAFAKGATIDPGCASCFWGFALALGPNYNMPMMAEARGRAGWEALTRARALAPRATPAERALIAALAKRYVGPELLDPASAAAPLKAYAAAMERVAAAYPADADVQTLTAEAGMNLNPWKLWNADGSPAAGTGAIVARLERVLAAHPDHPGANHYYVHAIEASTRPARALVSAERLKTAMPAAGHLVHMPSHILQRVGRYEESAEANRIAARADAAYYRQTAAIDYYPMYTAHNYQFLAAAAVMEGRRAETIDALRQARAAISDDALVGMPGIDWTIGFLYEAMVRFGMWDELLAEKAPDPRHVGLSADYLATRAIALAAKGRVDEAKAARAEFDRVIASAPADAGAGMNSARDLFAIAALRADARIAMAEGKRDAAIGLLTGAVEREDRLSYNEPTDQFFPARHPLGALLLDAGRPAEAEKMFRADLRVNPDNGWALFGLAQALEAQHRNAEAAAVRQRFTVAWRRADITLAAAAY
jgi:tetratricopeptide (TPR) repeat protein